MIVTVKWLLFNRSGDGAPRRSTFRCWYIVEHAASLNFRMADDWAENGKARVIDVRRLFGVQDA